MSTLPVSTNYRGRKVDLLLFQTSDPYASGKVTLSFSDTPQICAGVQKVSQIFITTFFTVLDSILADKKYGIDGFGEIGLTNVIPGQTQQVFELAVFDTLAVMKQEQDNLALEGVKLPYDEILTNVEIVDLSAVRDTVNLKIKLTTAAGTSRVIILPSPAALR
jgi:hypothetical protein